MEDNKKEGMCCGNDCKMCQAMHSMHGKGCCGGHRFLFLRIFLCFVILGAVFAMGVKLGELKGSLGGGFHKAPGYYMLNR